MAPELSAAILVVDDRPEQRLSLTALLGEVSDEIVTASSGRDALRQLLQRDFALILLDVNMPDMDGFETAELIRQRKRCEHTPIIFVTAYPDDAYAARGYSLGAVDYILAPFDPQVLKTKVSVFLDLFRKTEEASRHAEALRVHAAHLRRLADAAIAIHGASSMEDLLKLVTDTASAVTEAQQIAVTVEVPEPPDVGRSGSYTVVRPELTALDALGRLALVGAPARPLRMSCAELDGHATGDHVLRDPDAPKLRGWLAAPLCGREGRPMGWIQVSDRRRGEFGAEDETLLVQLAQMTAIAAENTLFTEVREASRLKDQFLATLSHELRTPLQAILSWSHLLRERPADPELTTRGLDVIERNALAQTRLIEELLDVSRIITGKLVLHRNPLRLDEVVAAAVEDAEAAARGKQISIEVGSTDEAWVTGDANRLRQVMGNLFSNAIKFTPSGGRVALDLANDGNTAEIRVSDTGQGVAAEFLPHLFERFRQADGGTRRTHGGLGIGLAVVRHLVELHGGTVRAESEGTGLGTTIFVRLPLTREEPSRGRAAEMLRDEAEELRLDGVRVLLVEDENDSRECLALALRSYGASVSAVGSVAEALQAYERAGADVVLSDLAMPAEDGYALIRHIRALPAERGRVPAAALSAHVRPEERARAVLAGFDAHVAKPIEPVELARSVRALADRDA